MCHAHLLLSQPYALRLEWLRDLLQSGRTDRAAHAFGVSKQVRRWDYEAAQRVTYFVANSRNVQKRIKDCYGRDSVVIYPPVNTELFSPSSDLSRSSVQRESNYFLLVSQLVPYKRIDLVVETFNRCGRPLVIVGDGPERKKLEKQAALNIRFAGSLPQKFVVRAMQQCRAFVFAGEEDFGIVMAEAQACGKPAVAFGKGGAAEIVTQGATGMLFNEQSADSLIARLDQFDQASFDPAAIRASALRFGRQRFLAEFSAFVRGVVGEFRGQSPNHPNLNCNSGD